MSDSKGYPKGYPKELSDEDLYDVFALCSYDLQVELCTRAKQFPKAADPLVAAIRDWQKQFKFSATLPTAKKPRVTNPEYDVEQHGLALLF
mgnify:CR=1 FL=1